MYSGSNRINRLREAAKRVGFNPNIWFGIVEQIARRAMGRETINYVANVNKYYIAYKLVFGLSEKRKHALEAIKSGGKD